MKFRKVTMAAAGLAVLGGTLLAAAPAEAAGTVVFNNASACNSTRMDYWHSGAYSYVSSCIQAQGDMMWYFYYR